MVVLKYIPILPETPSLNKEKGMPVSWMTYNSHKYDLLYI